MKTCSKCKGFGEYSHETEYNPDDPYGGIVLCNRCGGTGVCSDEPRTRPLQGGWMEKDCVTGEVREPLLSKFK